jgi:iron complex outermembrane receptor protein
MRLNPELLNKTEYRVVDTQLYGANAEWKLSPTLKLTGDIYESTSKRHSGGNDSYVVLRMNQPNVTRIQLTGSAVPEREDHLRRRPRPADGLAQGLFKDQRLQHPLLQPGRRQHRRQDHGATARARVEPSASGIDS